MNDSSSMRGRICIVTGASSGIGRATAFALARMGATVILACRNSTRAQNALREITQATESTEVMFMPLDLSEQKSVHSFAEEFKRRFASLHVLLNNAGIYAGRRVVTVDGFESTLAVNHLSHFLLTSLLLDRLKESAPSRVVNVASEAHWRGHIDFSDLQGVNRYSGWRAYGQSKLANILFTYELARRMAGTGIAANCVHPGLVRTNFGREGGGWMSVAVRVAAPFMLSPEEGARTVLYAASSPSLEYVTGKYLIRETEAESSRESHDVDVSRRLWETSTELTKAGA